MQFSSFDKFVISSNNHSHIYIYSRESNRFLIAVSIYAFEGCHLCIVLLQAQFDINSIKTRALFICVLQFFVCVCRSFLITQSMYTANCFQSYSKTSVTIFFHFFFLSFSLIDEHKSVTSFRSIVF